jgi:hypothetical protein
VHAGYFPAKFSDHKASSSDVASLIPDVVIIKTTTCDLRVVGEIKVIPFQLGKRSWRAMIGVIESGDTFTITTSNLQRMLCQVGSAGNAVVYATDCRDDKATLFRFLAMATAFFTSIRFLTKVYTALVWWLGGQYYETKDRLDDVCVIRLYKDN